MNAVFPSERSESSELDRHFAAFVARLGGDDPALRLAAAALSRSVREGHICLTLESIATAEPAAGEPATPRDAAEWSKALHRSPAVGSPDAPTPLVLDGAGRLYLRRYWNYQAQLARALLDKCSRNPAVAPSADATQQDAIAAVLRNELTIICGGPGTGKTSTVIRVLKQILQEQNGPRLRIALAAPTGKAASRLDESVREATSQVADGEQIRALIPAGAKTIHRLLGRWGRSIAFRHNAEHPLPLDFLIVDEASMVPPGADGPGFSTRCRNAAASSCWATPTNWPRSSPARSSPMWSKRRLSRPAHCRVALSPCARTIALVTTAASSKLAPPFVRATPTGSSRCCAQNATPISSRRKFPT